MFADAATAAPSASPHVARHAARPATPPAIPRAVHNNLDCVSVIKRGRTNSKKGAIKAAMGSTHAELIISEKSELTLDHILEEMLKVFVSDGGDFSVSALKADYEAMTTAAKLAAVKIEGAGGGKRLTAAEMGAEFVSGDKALSAVRENMGPFNWALFVPDETKLVFANAGSMGVNEMREWLKEDKVYFGIIRMGFGSGTFRRCVRSAAVPPRCSPQLTPVTFCCAQHEVVVLPLEWRRSWGCEARPRERRPRRAAPHAVAHERRHFRYGFGRVHAGGYHR